MASGFMGTDSQRSLAQLLVTMMNAREVEYARVSRALHDEVGQVLSAVGLQLDVLRMDFKDRVPDIAQRTQEIQQLLEKAVVHVRDLSYELNPAIVERAGLPFALERLADRFRKGFNGGLRLLIDPGVRLPLEVANIFYKIAEQGVENSVRHSGAAQVEILLHPASKGAALEIRDNGAGFEVEAVRDRSPGLGLILMEYYAGQAGLELAIKSAPGRGASIRLAYLG